MGLPSLSKPNITGVLREEDRDLAQGNTCSRHQRRRRRNPHGVRRCWHRPAAFQSASRNWRYPTHRGRCCADQRRHRGRRLFAEVAAARRMKGVRMKGEKVSLLPDERVAIHAELASALKGGDTAETLLAIILLLALRPPSRRKAPKKKGQPKRLP